MNLMLKISVLIKQLVDTLKDKRSAFPLTKYTDERLNKMTEAELRVEIQKLKNYRRR